MNIRSITAPNPGPFTLDGTRTYLLGGAAVIDPGPAIESHVDALVAAMPRLETILITHRHGDHAPAALRLRERTGARILAPPSVLGDRDVERRIEGGERIEIEDEPLEVLAAPGHTAEHVCFLTANGDLFTGDTILGFGTTAIFPPDGDMREYLETLRRLRSRNPRRIYPAHGPTRDDAVALIDEYIEHRLARERQIRDVLRGTRKTIRELRAAIYPDLQPGLEPAAEAQLLAHLIKLVGDGSVEEAGECWVLRVD